MTLNDLCVVSIKHANSRRPGML